MFSTKITHSCTWRKQKQ